MHLDEEKAAIARLKRGDIGGLAFLVERYQTQAVRTAYLILHNRMEAEEAVQRAFLRAYEYADKFDDRRPFAPWFRKIVANEAIQLARRSSNWLSLDACMDGDADWYESLTAADPPVEDLLEQARMKEQFWDILASLPVEQRAAIVMRYYHGLSSANIAAELQIPPGTVRWRIYAGLQLLRRLLSRRGWDG